MEQNSGMKARHRGWLETPSWSSDSRRIGVLTPELLIAQLHSFERILHDSNMIDGPFRSKDGQSFVVGYWDREVKRTEIYVVDVAAWNRN